MKKTKKQSSSIGAVFIVLSSFFYATYGIWTKLTGDFFGGYTASAIRSIFVLLILIPIAVLLKKTEPIRIKKNYKYLLGLVFFSFFIWGPLYYAVVNAGVALSLTINYACIALGMLIFGGVFLKERFTGVKILSIVLGIFGLAMTFSPDRASDIAWYALGAAALSGFSTAASIIIIKASPYGPVQISILSWVSSVVANLIMLVMVRESISASAEMKHYVYLLIFAVASVVASLCLAKGVKMIESGIAGILGLMEIVFGILFGVVLFSERPSILALTGALVIIIAASLPYVKSQQASG